MNFSYEMVQRFKEARNIRTDKEASETIQGLTSGNLSEIKKGNRHLSANQCIFIAEEIGLDPKEALLELAIEKSKSEKEKSILKDTLKKISAACILGIAIAAAQLSGHTVTPLSRNRRFNIT